MKKIFEEIQIILNYLTKDDHGKDLPKTDAVFVFGHVDKRVIQQAIKLFKKGKAEKIIISGGIGTNKRDPKGFPSEAQYFASIAKRSGIPQSKLILEEKASNTLENVVFGIKTANLIGFFPKSLILVALPPLLKRSEKTFIKQFPNIKIYKSAFLLNKDEWENKKSIRRLLGEIDRLKKYAEKGDIKYTNIPNKVISAYNNLKNQLS